VYTSSNSLARQSHLQLLADLLAVDLGNDVGVGTQAAGLQDIKLGHLDEDGAGRLLADQGRDLLHVAVGDVAAEEDDLGHGPLGRRPGDVAAEARGGDEVDLSAAQGRELALGRGQIQAGVDD